MTNQINNQGIIPPTDVIQLTLTLKMTTAGGCRDVSHCPQQQSYSEQDDQTQPTLAPTFVASLQHSQTYVRGLQCHSFKFLFEEQCTQNHPQYLSGLARALFRTTFLEKAVIYIYIYIYICICPFVERTFTWNGRMRRK